MALTAFISPSNVGPWQVLVIVLLVVFLFGGKKIPEISRALGRSLSEFKKGREEGERELAKSDKPDETDSDAPEQKT